MKVFVINSVASNPNEDGYTIVDACRSSLDYKALSSLDGELSIRQHDVYCGELIKKYREEMPVWVFLEIISFGRFIDFCKFCASRWNDDTLLDRHYMLKKAKSLRNATAHGSCIMNGFAEQENNLGKLPKTVSREISKIGINNRLKKARLSNTRMIEIATTLFLYAELIPEGQSKNSSVAKLNSFFNTFDRDSALFMSNGMVFSAIRFLNRLTLGLGLS